jgi:hypothetical protein
VEPTNSRSATVYRAALNTAYNFRRPALENARFPPKTLSITGIAVLNKINVATVMALRAGHDTNQLLVSL